MRHSIWVILAFLVCLSAQSHPAHSAGLFFGPNQSDGLGRIDTATGDVTSFPGLGNAASISALTFDTAGRLWGNTSMGVGEFDTHTGSFSVLVDPATVEDPDIGGTPGFSVTSLASGAGGVFLGDLDRLVRIDVSTGDVTFFPRLGFAAGINFLSFDGSGTLWGNVTGTGIGQFDITTGAFSLLVDPGTVENPEIGGTPGFFVTSFVASAGALFIGDQDRLARVDVATGDVTFFPHLGLVGEVNALSFDGSGRLWGNVTGTGIGEFDTNTGTFALLVDPTTVLDPNTGMPGSPAEFLAASPVPEPSSIVLVSSAAVGLLGFVRRATRGRGRHDDAPMTSRHVLSQSGADTESEAQR